MAFSLDIRPAEALGHIRLTGSVDGDDLIGSLQAATSHPDWEPPFTLILDGAGIEALGVGLDDIHRLLGIRRTLRETGRMAGVHVVVARRALDFDVARLAVRMCRWPGAVHHVVRTTAEALALATAHASARHDLAA